MKIEIYGFKSFKEWIDCGCPGAKSFPLKDEVVPDKRRGLCTHDDCDNVVHGSGSAILELCGRHMQELRQERQKMSA